MIVLLSIILSSAEVKASAFWTAERSNGALAGQITFEVGDNSTTFLYAIRNGKTESLRPKIPVGNRHLQCLDMPVVLLNRRFYRLIPLTIQDKKLSFRGYLDAIVKILGLQHKNIQKTVNHQVVDLRHQPPVFNAKIMNHRPVFGVFVTEIKIVGRILFIALARLQALQFALNVKTLLRRQLQTQQAVQFCDVAITIVFFFRIMLRLLLF